MTGLGLHSHRELDCSLFLYPESRKRAEGKRLSRPGRINGFGQTLIVYPDFGLAGMVVDRPSASERELIERIGSEAQALYVTGPFREFHRLVAPRLRKGWILDELIAHVAQANDQVLIELHGEIAEAEARLREHGVAVEKAVGLLRAVSGGAFVIDQEPEPIRSKPINAGVSRLEPGAWVVRDLIQLGSRSGELVVPTVDPIVLPDALRKVGERAVRADEQGSEWEAMLSNLDYTPLKVPVLDANELEADARDGVLATTVEPELRVSIDLEGLATANSMARASRSAAA